MADIEYLKGLKAVRERAHLVLKAAEHEDLTHFSYFPDLMPKVTDYVAGIIDVRLHPESDRWMAYSNCEYPARLWS